MDFRILALIATIVLNTLIALTLAYSSRSLKKDTALFSFSALMLGFWSLGALFLLTSNTEDLAVLAAKIFFVAPLLISFFVYVFTRYFPTSKDQSKTPFYWVHITVLLGVAAVVFLHDKAYAIEELSIDPEGINEITIDIMKYLLLTVYVVVFLLATFHNLRKKSKNVRGHERQQLLYIFTGTALTSLSALTAVAVAYSTDSFTQFVWLGPFLTLIYLIFVSIAITKKHLFDIRLLVARWVGYGFISLAFFGVFVFVGTFLGKTILDFKLTIQQEVYLAFMTMTLALLYVPLKSFVDKATSWVFYKDSYDPQEALRDFSDFLVAEIDLEVLYGKVKDILTRTVRPESSFVLLKDSDSKTRFSDTTTSKSLNRDRELIKTLEYQSTPVMFANDDTAGLEAFAVNIAHKLQDHQFELSVRLSTEDELVGFLLLGSKKNGNYYNHQDTGFLSTMANQLSIALQNAQRFSEIQSFNLTLQKKIDDATRELRETNEKLKHLDEAKDEFISMASHQLRTPLTSIKGYLSMMLEGDMGEINEKQRELLKSAYTSSQRMVYLISDFLNVSRLKTGKFVIDPTEVYLPDMVESQINQVIEVATSRGLKVYYEKPEDFPKTMLDKNKTDQVIMNFLDNAIFYSKSGGNIIVKLDKSDKSVSYSVIDDGMGVPKKDQMNLFTKFFRATNARKARPDGTGLGLFMAKKVIVAQGGAIVFKTKEGQGSTFGFSFPLDKVEVKDNQKTAPKGG